MRKYARKQNGRFSIMVTAFKFLIIISMLTRTITSTTEKEKVQKATAEHQKSSDAPPPPRVITEYELSEYTGTNNDGDDNGGSSSTIWLSILGSVYDVTEGPSYYGPGRGYHFFAGKDASPTFITGKFNPEGLLTEVESMKDEELAGIEHWRKFYEDHEKYKFVGVLEGTYYDERGDPTEMLRRIRERVALAEEKAEKEKEERENAKKEKKEEEKKAKEEESVASEESLEKETKELTKEKEKEEAILQERLDRSKDGKSSETSEKNEEL